MMKLKQILLYLTIAVSIYSGKSSLSNLLKQLSHPQEVFAKPYMEAAWNWTLKKTKQLQPFFNLERAIRVSFIEKILSIDETEYIFTYYDQKEKDVYNATLSIFKNYSIILKNFKMKTNYKMTNPISVEPFDTDMAYWLSYFKQAVEFGPLDSAESHTNYLYPISLFKEVLDNNRKLYNGTLLIEQYPSENKFFIEFSGMFFVNYNNFLIVFDKKPSIGIILFFKIF